MWMGKRRDYLPAVIATCLLAACTPIEELPRTTSPELLDSVRNGTVQLTCVSSSCANAWTARAELAANLTIQARWAELSSLLVTTGYRSDLTWYFLGRAADGLGSPKAAARYYETARAELGDARSCNVSGLCRETNIGAAIDSGLSRAKSAAAGKVAAR
jgi:hypothetical protein